MEKYYTIFDIINGLKPEYIKTKEELEALKRFVKVCSKNLGVDFFLQAFDGIGQPKLLYYMRKTGLIDDLAYKFSGNISRSFPIKLMKRNNVYYIPEKNVYINNYPLFDAMIDDILNCDFAQNISFRKNIGNFVIDIDSNYINFSDGNKSLMYPVNNDSYRVPSSKVGLLSYEVAQSELPKYHVSMIEKNKSLKKIR